MPIAFMRKVNGARPDYHALTIAQAVRPSSRASAFSRPISGSSSFNSGPSSRPVERQPQRMEQRAPLAAARRLERRNPHVPGRVVPRLIGKQRCSLVGQLAVLDHGLRLRR